MLLNQFDQHLQTTCPYRIVICQYCTESILKKDLEHHMNKLCTMKPKKCENIDCNYIGTNDELKKHLLTCTHRIISCPFEKFGCTIKLKVSEMNQHTTNNTNQHLLYTMTYINTLEQRICKLELK